MIFPAAGFRSAVEHQQQAVLMLRQVWQDPCHRDYGIVTFSCLVGQDVAALL
jgi:hypothetical protein